MVAEVSDRNLIVSDALELVYPPDVEKAWFHAYFMYDIAESIDVNGLLAAGDNGFQRVQLQLRTGSIPKHLRFPVGPIAANLPEISINGVEAKVRVKIYAYGVVSLRLSFPFQGSWFDYAKFTREMRQSEEVSETACKLLEDISQDIQATKGGVRERVMEDYFFFHIERFNVENVSSDALTGTYGPAVAALLVGESKRMTEMEQNEILKVCFSYFPNDLAVVDWNAAFLYEDEVEAEAVEAIIEYANTQLVELRTYDARLDKELVKLSRTNLTETNDKAWKRKQADDRARKLGVLLVNVRDLMERSGNSLKITGDAYYARLYRGCQTRLGIADWQEQVEKKLVDLREIYHFFTDEAHHAQGEFLELIVIWLIVIEVVLGVVSLFIEVMF